MIDFNTIDWTTHSGPPFVILATLFVHICKYINVDGFNEYKLQSVFPQWVFEVVKACIPLAVHSSSSVAI